MHVTPHLLSIIIALALVGDLHAQSSFWRQLDQPFGGDVGAFVGGPDGSALVGIRDDGIARSTDDGVTWAPFGPGRNVRPVLYSSGRTLFGIDNSSGQHYRADDTASAWTALSVSGGRGLAPMIETPGGAILLAGDNGIDRSTDEGRTWTNVAPANALFRFPARCARPTIYAVADRADIYRSSDDGRTWTFACVLTDGPIVALLPLDDGSVVAGTYNGLYRSTDSATRFTRLALAGVSIMSLGLARLDVSTFVAATPGGAYIVGVDGSTTPISYLPPGELGSVHVTRAGAILLGYRARGIVRSMDRGVTFDAVGLAHGWDVVNMNEGPDGAIYASASGSALNPDVGAFFRSTDRGMTWVDLRLYAGHPYQIVAPRVGMLVGLGGSRLFRSTDNGLTWSRHTKPEELYDIVVARDGAIVGSTNRGVLRSTDDGDTWTTVTTTEHLYDIAASPDGELWAIGTKLHRSTDDGLTWTERPITAPRVPYGGYRRLALPVEGVLVLLAHESLPTVVRSTDAGETWDTTGFRCQYGASMMRDFGPLGMYIVSDCGVAMSRDAGATWTVLAPKPPGERWGIVLAHSGGDLYFSGWTGIHVGTLPTGIRPAARSHVDRPTIIATTSGARDVIECRLPRTDEVTLTITTMHGETVATLFSGTLSAGEHRFELGEGVPSGAYIVSLASGGFTATTLLRSVR